MTDDVRPFVTPLLERPAGDFVYRFPLGGVEAVVRLANLHASHGDFTFNLWANTVDADTGEPRGHLHWSKFNISSEPTRSRMAQTLDKKSKGLLLDWDRALEYVCTKTYQVLQEGEPEVDLDEVEVDESAPNELVEGFLALDQPNLIFAAGGSLKSYVALVVALCVRLGTPIGPFKPLQQLPVLYADAETVKQEQALRMRALCRGLGIAPVKLPYLRLSMPLAQQRDQLARTIARRGVRLLIVDSMAPALGGSVNDDDLVNAFFDALMTFGITVLVIAHETKAQRQKRGALPTPIGSGFAEYRSRACWYVENATPPGADRYAVNKLVLTCTKANNGPKGARVVVTFQWRPDGSVAVGTADARRDPELVAQFGSNKDKVRRLLGDGRKRTYKEIAEELGLSVNSVKTAVSRLGAEVATFPAPPGAANRETQFALTAYPDPTPIRRLVEEVPLDDATEALDALVRDATADDEVM